MDNTIVTPLDHTGIANTCTVFDSMSLVPESWRQELADMQRAERIAAGMLPEEADAAVQAALRFRVFNPTLIEVPGGFAMCYRVVADNTDVRRLATCQLSPSLEVIADSVTPLSDLIEFMDPELQDPRARTWHADPRYLRLHGKLYVIWNDGANRPLNHQFIMELDDQGLRPTAGAREITRDLKREAIEKNWMLFEAQDAVWATYSIEPHEVLRVDFDASPVILGSSGSVAKWHTAYSDLYGELRGSAQPVRDGDGFLVIAHSSYKTVEGRKYCASFYRHEGVSPFRVTFASSEPFDLPNPKGTTFEMKKLNKEVSEVIYPCGFVVQGDEAIISYGLNDEACAVVRVPLADIERAMAPVRKDATFQLASPLLATDAAANIDVPRVDLPKPSLPLFWWDAAGKKFDGVFGKRIFEVGNFGDIASKEVAERISGARLRQPKKGERKLVSIGSVLHTARNGDIVWGTGAKGSALQLAEGVNDLSVHAVRGPLTAEFLRKSGIDISRIKAFFDPGCLIPVLYREEIEAFRLDPKVRRGGVRIIPHYHDDLNWRRQHTRHLRDFVSVDASPATMIRQIIGADRVISSSLHGLIFAEALGIPAIWLAPSEKEDQMKYFDYYYGSGRQRVKCYETLDEALRADPMPLPTFDFDAYLASFPHEELMAIQPFGLVLGEKRSLGGMEVEEREETLAAANFERVDVGGMWLTAERGVIRTQIRSASADTRYRLEIYLYPFNPTQLSSPQHLTVRVNGGPAAVLEWPAGSRAPVNVELLVNGRDGNLPLDIVFEARHARSPRTLGISPIGQTLAACVSSIGVFPAA